MEDHAQLEQMLRSLRATQERLGEVQDRVSSAYGTARSRDNLVSCTVGPGGNITELHISPRAMDSYRADQLAGTIRDVITEANAQLHAYVAEQYRDVLGESFDPASLADPDAAAEAIRAMRDRLRRNSSQ